MTSNSSLKLKILVVFLWSLTVLFYFFGAIVGIIALTSFFFEVGNLVLIPILILASLAVIFLPFAGLPEIFQENFDKKFTAGVLGLNVILGAIGFTTFYFLTDWER